jgi:hypothetical protein
MQMQMVRELLKRMRKKEKNDIFNYFELWTLIRFDLDFEMPFPTESWFIIYFIDLQK